MKTGMLSVCSSTLTVTPAAVRTLEAYVTIEKAPFRAWTNIKEKAIKNPLRHTLTLTVKKRR